jgi:hypothetical protein
MTREIHLPHHGDITAPLSTALDAARSLPTDDARATARQIVIALAADGVDTVGAALAHLEAASPAERRGMLDDARTAAGLATATAVKAKNAHAQQDRLLSAAAGDDVELRLTPGPTGWVDLDAQALEAAQARAEAERREVARAQGRAARAAQLPELEEQARAEAAHWRSANVHVEMTTQ